MTPEELDEARAKEAYRQADGADRYLTHFEAAIISARLAREGWTPPEPVDPDILAFREWLMERLPADSEAVRKGLYDEQAAGFLAGARMAREQERERARPLVRYAEHLKHGFFLYANYREHAAQALAKYREKRDG